VQGVLHGAVESANHFQAPWRRLPGQLKFRAESGRGSFLAKITYCLAPAERLLHGSGGAVKLKDVLGETYGVMLYQEDVMRIAVDLAGYTLAEANQFRTEVSKKVSAVRLQRQYVDFVYNKAEQQGIDRHTAEAIWEQILKFAAYSYCKAHATVYANIAWQTAFLKAHYPQQFFTSLFNNHHGMYPLRVYVWQAIRHGIKILPPHVNHSEIEWTTQGKAIRAGLNIIKGLLLGGIDFNHSILVFFCKTVEMNYSIFLYFF